MEDVKIIELDGQNHPEDFTIKFVIVGDSGVGKTNILNRFIRNSFYMDGKSTIGIELETKMFRIQDKYLKLNIWDTAGQERFKSVTHAFYKGAKGAIIVFDITREITFNNVDYWFKEIKESSHMKDMNLILIGNKSDLDERRQVTVEKGVEKATNMGVAYMETSAKDNLNIGDAFKKLINKVYFDTIMKDIGSTKIEKVDKGEGIKINEKMVAAANETSESKKKGCC